ncbi:esterase [Saccharobesus litoralis]|uniref:Esterase n=2 Tax=Saccharobesus litoralis TaxID=2172099 RepID=A0A2S0VXY5_9ALTE|nr:esterase [Saccharobesus litoralis]
MLKKLLSSLSALLISIGLLPHKTLAQSTNNELPLDLEKLITATRQIDSGQLTIINHFPSKYVAPRSIRIWLPKQYTDLASKGDKLAVLYMHDGQMLFDASITWNGQEWAADNVAADLIKANNVKPFIIVGIDNGGVDLRRAEYFPQKAFELLSHAQQQALYGTMRSDNEKLFGAKVQSDSFLKFVVTELKPYIDQHYAVHSNAEHTFMLGSSMGGLISMYALSEYPKVFGGVACMSTHWPGKHTLDNNPIPQAFYQYVEQYLPAAGAHKLYFDYGDQTLDALYPALQQQVDTLISAKGYDKKHWQTQFFAGAAHTENDWQQRLHIPLIFLLGK